MCDDIKPISSCESRPKRVRNIQLQKLLLTEFGWPGSECQVLPLVQTPVLWRWIFLPALLLSFRASAQICPEVRKKWCEHLLMRDRGVGGGLKCHWWSVPGDQLAGESISQPLLLCPDSIHPHPSAPIVLSGCRFGDEVSLDVGWDRLPCWSICGLITIITWARRDDRWGVLNLGLSLFQLTIWLLPGNYSSDLFSAVSIQGFWPLTPPCEISKIYLMVKDKDIWKTGHTVLLPDPQSEGGSLRFIPVWIKMSNVVYKLL